MLSDQKAVNTPLWLWLALAMQHAASEAESAAVWAAARAVACGVVTVATAAACEEGLREAAETVEVGGAEEGALAASTCPCVCDLVTMSTSPRAGHHGAHWQTNAPTIT